MPDLSSLQAFTMCETSKSELESPPEPEAEAQEAEGSKSESKKARKSREPQKRTKTGCMSMLTTYQSSTIHMHTLAFLMPMLSGCFLRARCGHGRFMLLYLRSRDHHLCFRPGNHVLRCLRWFKLTCSSLSTPSCQM